MKNIKNKPTQLVFILLFYFLFQNQAYSSSEEEAEVPNPLAKIQGQILPKNNSLLAITIENPKGWHTYWKNPGDAGLPLKFSFSKGPLEKNEELKEGPQEKEWPTPSRYIENGDIWAYGYQDSHSFFFDLPANFISEMEGQNFNLKTTFLLCKNICVPGEIVISSVIEQGNYKAFNSEINISEEELLKRLQNIPQIVSKENELDFILAKESENKLVLYYNYPPNSISKNTSLNLITPFPLVPFSFKRESLYKDKEGHLYGKIPIDWDGEYQEPALPFPLDGKFQTTFNFQFLLADAEGTSFVIKKNFNSFQIDAGKKLEEFYKTLTEIKANNKNEINNDNNDNNDNDNNDINSYTDNEEGTNTDTGLLLAIILAFLGGFILNAMPCVLPIISLKLFSLAKMRSEKPHQIMRHNLFYTLGILLTFLALAVIIIILKNLGTQVGWGFQLQSPIFVFFMIIILFLMSLNFFGTYELSTPGGASLANIKIKEGPWNDLFSGFLATVLSTPCSAPFLGTALTYAFTSSAVITILIFIMIGLGLSLPFLVTAFIPQLINFIPRPGEWMNHLKKYLGLALILTVIWLIDVFIALTSDWGNLPLMQLLTLIAFITFSFLIIPSLKSIAAKVIHLVLTLSLAVWPLITLNQEINTSSESPLIAEKNLNELSWEKWSEDKMVEYQNAGQATFVDFTAKWCFTCKANEKLVIETEGFKELAKKYQLKLLLADWTKRDELIGNWLKSHQLSGIPAYFVINQNKELIKLGETLSLSKIEKALQGVK